MSSSTLSGKGLIAPVDLRRNFAGSRSADKTKRNKAVDTPRSDFFQRSLRAIEAELKIQQSAFDPAHEARRFTMMISDHASGVVLGETLRMISGRAPGIAIEVLPLADNGLTELQQGKIDLLIKRAEAIPAAQPVEDLFVDEYACAVWSGNSKIGHSISIEDYLSLGHIVTTSDKEALENPGEHYPTLRANGNLLDWIVPNFGALLQTLIGSKRVATVPKQIALAFGQHYPVRVLPLPFEMRPIREVMFWNKMQSGDVGVTWLRQMLKTAARTEASPAMESLTHAASNFKEAALSKIRFWR